MTFDTDPGDKFDIRATIVPGPLPPGPTRMLVYIQVNGNRVQEQWLGDGEHASTFDSPGGQVTICSAVRLADPSNWDSDDRGSLSVTHRRKKTNLVASGPHIWWDERWVGFGYRVENNRVNHGSASVELRYAMKSKSGSDVLLDTLRSRPIKPDEGTELNWENDQGNFRVPFAEMGVPPDEATHMVSVVDVEKSVDELDEGDNVKWHDLPEWRGTVEWTDLSLASTPTSIPKGKDAPKATRLMKVYELRIRVHQEIWKQRVVARHRCSIRVYMSSDRTGSAAGFRGWIFPPSMDKQLSGSRIDIGDDVRIAEKHPPVNALREDTSPRGARNSPSSYLFIPCDQINQSTGDLPLRYIPCAIKGTDEIRVELWDDILNKQIADPISRKITATQEYTLTWRKEPPAMVRASVLLKKSRDVSLQPHRHCEPYLIRARALLNGRPVDNSYTMRVTVRPLRESIAGDGMFKTDAKSPRSWLFPEKYGKPLQANPIKIKKNKKANTVSLVEPGLPKDLRGVRTKTQPYFDVPINDRGEAALWVVPPGVSGEDELVLQLIDTARSKEKKPPVHAKLRQRVRVLRHKVPTIFVPGIMGSRINILVDNFVIRWDLGNFDKSILNTGAWFAAGLTSTEKMRLMLHCSNPAEVMEGEHDNEEEARRGYAGLFSGYLPSMRQFHGNRYIVEPFDFVTYGAGYDFRKSNIHSGVYLLTRVSSILSLEKDELGPAQWFVMITHSMGGLASRSMLRQSAEIRNKCLAVVHGFQPTTGAPLAFRRILTGFTLDSSGFVGFVGDALLQSVLGGDPSDYVIATSGVQGGFDLLPSRQYPKSWFTTIEGSHDVVPIGEVYPVPPDVRKYDPQQMPDVYNSDNARYGILAPVRSSYSDQVFMQSELKARVDSALQLHELLATETGPYKLEDRTWSVYGVGFETDIETFVDLNPGVFRTVSNTRSPDGDGTVPAASGAALFPSQTGFSGDVVPSETIRQLRVTGFDHQSGWNSPDAQRFALRAIRFAVAGVADPN